MTIIVLHGLLINISFKEHNRQDQTENGAVDLLLTIVERKNLDMQNLCVSSM